MHLTLVADVGPVADTGVSRAGGGPGVVPAPGRLGGGRVVVAGGCQCCGTSVPAAGRGSCCVRCGGRVVHPINKNGRRGVSRDGHTQEVDSPMQDAGYRLAQDALGTLRYGPWSVPAACVCGDDLDGRMLLVRDFEADGESFDSLISDDGSGDGPSVLGRCWSCDRELLPDVVVLRDRHGRCARYLAEVA